MRVLATLTTALWCIAGLGVGAYAREPFVCDASRAEGPLTAPWRTLDPDPAYHGQWLVAGDLDDDGTAEIVTARHDQQRVTAAIATKLDGRVLWRWGTPNAGSNVLYCDVPVQIYDLDGDGRTEVWISPQHFLLVLDGKTGKELRRLSLPTGLEVADSIAFANLRGTKRPTDIIIKDRYKHIWAYTSEWKPLWDWAPARYMTCHYPTLIDINRDGRDEVLAGYSLLGHDGRELWTLRSNKIDLGRGHLDCGEILTTGRRPEDWRVIVSYCGANGMALINGAGETLWEVTGRHFESVDAGKIRPDVPGRQIVVDIAHERRGEARLWLLDEQGNRLGEFICGGSRHHRLIDWNGDGLDEILIAQPCRLFDGRGRCVARLGPVDVPEMDTPSRPAGDPGPLAATGDLDGDGRPEIILHSAKRVVVYRSEQAAKLGTGTLGTGVNFTLY